MFFAIAVKDDGEWVYDDPLVGETVDEIKDLVKTVWKDLPVNTEIEIYQGSLLETYKKV